MTLPLLQTCSFIAIKPDGVQRGLIGDIISRFEKRGYKLVALKLVTPSKEHMEKHYEDLAQKPFYKGLVTCMSDHYPLFTSPTATSPPSSLFIVNSSPPTSKRAHKNPTTNSISLSLSLAKQTCSQVQSAPWSGKAATP